MQRLEFACVALGGVLLTSGLAVTYWPAALIVDGLLLMAVGWDRGDA